MNQAMGNTAIINVVIVFVIIISGMFVGSLSYSKAYKVKNTIINVIEEHGEYNDVAKAEIERILSDMGYRVNRNGHQKCVFENGQYTGVKDVRILNNASNHRYCVFEVVEDRAKYYVVESYMYYDIPLVEGFEVPVRGHTKPIYNDDAHDQIRSK